MRLLCTIIKRYDYTCIHEVSAFFTFLLNRRIHQHHEIIRCTFSCAHLLALNIASVQPNESPHTHIYIYLCEVERFAPCTYLLSKNSRTEAHCQAFGFFILSVNSRTSLPSKRRWYYTLQTAIVHRNDSSVLMHSSTTNIKYTYLYFIYNSIYFRGNFGYTLDI